MEPERRTDDQALEPARLPREDFRPDARPPYEPPTLVDLGTLRDLTATGSTFVPTIPGAP